MEIRAGEGKPFVPKPEISEARVKRFIRSLPPEGIILHGALTTDIPGVEKMGLSSLGRNAHLYPNSNRFTERLAGILLGEQNNNYVFYFFLKINEKPSFDEYSPKETRKIINALRLSINECIYYGDEPPGSPASIVLAKKPSHGLLFGGDHRSSMISRVQGGLPIGASRLTIPSRDIITILSPSKDIKSSRKERVDDLLKEVIDGVINWKNNSASHVANPVQRVVSRFLK